jgi:hypothetical protein
MNQKPPDNERPQKEQQQLKVRWDNTAMRSSYANVCNVAGTREEIVLT